MAKVSKTASWIVALCLVMVGASSMHREFTVFAQSSPRSATVPQTPEASHENESGDPDIPDEPGEDELAPAAVHLDVSKQSPLLQALYNATRETKETDILARLDEAKQLIASGANLKETDAQGRTALHWAVFGSSYANNSSVIVAYEEIADSLIQKGIDINHEDIYQDTALDYLLYSPTFEMQTLLMENGATSGFLVATFRFFDQMQMQFPAQNVDRCQEPDAEGRARGKVGAAGEAYGLGHPSKASSPAQATMRNTGYKSGPVSTLLLNGQAPDLVFQKSLNTFAKRHHIRIWKMKKTHKGRDVWIGAATHDIATEKSRGYTKWTHRIDPHIDRERDWIQSDLLFSGMAVAYADVGRPHAPKKAANGSGCASRRLGRSQRCQLSVLSTLKKQLLQHFGISVI